MQEIKLYGRIGTDIRAAEVCSALENLPQGFPVTLALHSEGGDVIEGNLIANAISKVQATIRIDGLAASMGAMLLPYARKVQMADNAFIMIHQPRATAGGTKREMQTTAKLLDNITEDFVKKLIIRTQKPEAEVRSWFEGDTWFSASEALEAGLIDEIVPAVAERQTATLVGDFASVLAVFNQCLIDDKTDKNITFTQNLETTNQKEMKKELIEALALNITEEQDDKSFVEATIQKVADLQKRNEELEAQLKDHKLKEVTQIIDQAISQGKLKADMKEYFVKLGMESSVEQLQTIFEAIPEIPKAKSLQEMITKSETKTTHSWDELDRSGRLQALKANDYQEFCRLFKEKFGKEYAV